MPAKRPARSPCQARAAVRPGKPEKETGGVNVEDGREMDPEMLCMGCMGQRTSMEGPCPFCGFDETAGERPLHHLPYRTILNGKYLIGKAIGEGGFGIT